MSVKRIFNFTSSYTFPSFQFLPNYMRDVLEFAPTANGFISALPIFCLFVSKTLSASLSSWLTVKKEYDKTFVCKVRIPSLSLSPTA